ncbi:MAG: hypothetical protein LBF22_07880 [Deltaproteobacteria bacterium]|nr:hypothetical protein [Deltaproteobacteria bacterium]
MTTGSEVFSDRLTRSGEYTSQIGLNPFSSPSAFALLSVNYTFTPLH